MNSRRQFDQRIASLKAAGIEFVPRAMSINEVPVVADKKGIEEIDLSSEQDAALDAAEAKRDRKRELTVLAAEVAKCSRCPELFATRTQTVFGVGPLSPELCVVGEAPGADEDRTGEPFVGRAGQLLDKILLASGFARNDVYICNTLKCRPPSNATPTPVQCANCRPYFERQIDLIQPKYIACFGSIAAQNVLSTTLAIGKLRGKLHDYRGIPVLATYHPAYLLRNPDAKKFVWEDMQFLVATMGRELPKK